MKMKRRALVQSVGTLIVGLVVGFLIGGYVVPGEEGPIFGGYRGTHYPRLPRGPGGCVCEIWANLPELVMDDLPGATAATLMGVYYSPRGCLPPEGEVITLSVSGLPKDVSRNKDPWATATFTQSSGKLPFEFGFKLVAGDFATVVGTYHFTITATGRINSCSIDMALIVK